MNADVLEETSGPGALPSKGKTKDDDEDAIVPEQMVSVTGKKRGKSEGATRRKKLKRIPNWYAPASGPMPEPDPERWLPKQERSTYKKPKKRGAKKDENTIKGGQGAVTKDQMEKLDASANAVKVRSATVAFLVLLGITAHCSPLYYRKVRHLLCHPLKGPRQRKAVAKRRAGDRLNRYRMMSDVIHKCS